MSGVALKWAWEQQLPVTGKLVLIVLAYHANKLGLAWAGSTRMRRETGLSRTGFKSQIRKLENTGFVKRESRFTNAGRQTSNGYQLNMGGVTQCDPSWGHELQTPQGSLATDPLDIQYEIQEGDTSCGEPQETPMKIEELLNQRENLTREEIFSNAIRTEDKLTPDGCAFIWRNCRASADEDNGFQAEILIREKKMLHSAYKRVGEDFNLAIWAVMANWIGFTKHAADTAGAFNLPNYPTISFFIKFIEAAVDFKSKNDYSANSGFVQLTAKQDNHLTKPNENKDNGATAITSDELAAISEEFE